MKHPTWFPNTLQSLHQYLLCPLQSNQEGRKSQSLRGKSRMFFFYMERNSDNCCKFGISSTFSIPLLLPFPCGQPKPPFLCPQVSRHSLPGCKAGGLAAPGCSPLQAFPFPSIWASGAEAAFPTQSLVSLPEGRQQIWFQAASRGMLCTLFYCIWRFMPYSRLSMVVSLVSRASLHADLIPLQVLSTYIK